MIEIIALNKLNSWQELQETASGKLNIYLDEGIINKLKIFYEILFETNKYINLTRLINLDDFLTFHVLDTLVSIYYLNKESIVYPKPS